jgi:tetratricopeptide (TPR) repeat protein
MEADLVCEAMPTEVRQHPTTEHQRQRDEAISLYQQARQVMEPLADKNPDVAEYQGALAEVFMNIGQTEAEQGRTQNALAAFRRAEAILVQLVANRTEVARYRPHLIAVLGVLAKLETDPAKQQQVLNNLESLKRELGQANEQQR